ncbi:thermonuclease family protein [Aquibacillus kalidii]|uniref:thermonuclease family protein n=1 Tax=Aquibacillus kalidii TaxID=2762597 RepID=UPI001F1F7AE0|nr:thermonuclease family protein [Aquibacillus kalidii]
MGFRFHRKINTSSKDLSDSTSIPGTGISYNQRIATKNKSKMPTLIALIGVFILFSGCSAQATNEDNPADMEETTIPAEQSDETKSSEGETDTLEENTEKQSLEDTSSSATEVESDVTSEMNSNLVEATVTRIVDGDTIEVSINGKEDVIRLLLVDTPETKHPSLPVQDFGPEASQFAKDTLTGKNVQIEKDGPERDKYDRLLAYLWVDGKMFNQLLLEEGLARLAYVYDPPYTHYEAYMKAQNRAKDAGKGIWRIDGYVTEEGFNQPEPVAKTEPEPTPDAETEQNNSSSLNYDPNGIDRNCGDFDTQQEAQDFYEAAGGPTQDPHRLDGNDNDGLVCESL